MSFPRLLIMLATFLFTLIAAVAFFRGSSSAVAPPPIEVELAQDIRILPPPVQKKSVQKKSEPESKVLQEEPIQETNRIEEFFSVDGKKLPIVETIIYKSRVAWQQGRPAWLSDYARYYETSRHFIARSLNRKSDYFKQDVADGNKFNVLRKDKKIQFTLLVDISRCKLSLFYEDLSDHQKVLLKTYTVSLGRPDGSKESGLLTPLGKYSLGNKTAIYKPKSMGFYRGEQTEMISVFGTRWIPFDKEIEGCTAPSKGLGIHGLPWMLTSSGKRDEDRSSLGEYKSDGCIRMASEDIEEIFAIIITRPAFVEIVKGK